MSRFVYDDRQEAIFKRITPKDIRYFRAYNNAKPVIC